jgi:hypothetical protein
MVKYINVDQIYEISQESALIAILIIISNTIKATSAGFIQF